MIESDLPPRDTKERILDAAEELFAEHGVEATSLRGITTAAHANVAAAHYHFGSKEAVLRAVMSRRFEPINQERLERLEQLEAAAGGAALSIEELLRAFLEPAIVALADLGPRSAIVTRLVAQIYVDPSEPLKTVVLSQFGEVMTRFGTALIRTLSEIPPAEVMLRFHFTTGVLHSALSLESMPEVAEFSPVPLPDFDYHATLDRMISFLAAGLSAPTLRSPRVPGGA